MADRRGLHPGAWWIWALGLATAASHTTNPLLLGLLIAVAGLVVAARRGSAPWAAGFRWYLLVAGIVLVSRVVFRALTAGDGPTVVLDLPGLDLPGNITVLGPISAEALVAGFYDGLRLAALIVCVGAANSLADAKRLLAAAPPALYEVGTALVVSVSVFPQIIESAGRVRRARSLRGEPASRRHLLREVVVPVLNEALDRSLQLAASMDSRGYGRSADGRGRRLTAVLLVAGLLGIAVGVYALLDATSPAYLGTPVLVAGLVIGLFGFVRAGSRVRRTRYRPQPWAAAEYSVAGAGVVAAAAVLATDSSVLYPTANPLVWPTLAVLPVLGLLVAALPAVLAPAPRMVPA